MKELIILVGNSGGIACTTTKEHRFAPTRGCKCLVCENNRKSWSEKEHEIEVFLSRNNSSSLYENY